MRGSCISIALLCTVIMSAASAGPKAVPELSGDITIADSLNLSQAGEISFRAELNTVTGRVCQVVGALYVYVNNERPDTYRLPRQLTTIPNKTFIYCPGQQPLMVTGQLAVEPWVPPQDIRKLSTRYTSELKVTTAAGLKTKWLTWHVANPKRVKA